MKITIDTKEDKPEDIRKIVALLSQMIGDKGRGWGRGEEREERSRNIFESSSPEVSGFVSLFGGGEKKEGVGEKEEAEGVEEMKEEEVPEVVEY